MGTICKRSSTISRTQTQTGAADVIQPTSIVCRWYTQIRLSQFNLVKHVRVSKYLLQITSYIFSLKASQIYWKTYLTWTTSYIIRNLANVVFVGMISFKISVKSIAFIKCTNNNSNVTLFYLLYFSICLFIFILLNNLCTFSIQLGTEMANHH